MGFWVGCGGGAGVRLESDVAGEIERRPRGASRRKAAPTFVATCQTCKAMVARLVDLTMPVR